MLVGIPKEIKVHEYRVGLAPAGVHELAVRGHGVLVERGAGVAIGFTDADYVAAGAHIAASAAEVFERAALIVKVKEPQPPECELLREGQIVFAFFHLAPDPLLAQRLLASGATCVAYETVRDAVGGLPLLAPMSEVAGRMAIQAGIHHLEIAQGGSGVLLGGVPGVAPGKVAVLGGGVVGANAAAMAVGLGAQVTVLDRSLPRLRHLSELFGNRISTVYAGGHAIEQYIGDADLAVGAVLLPGAAAPKLVERRHIAAMRRGSVVVDVAIDQGGCFATSRPTTHQEPTYQVDGVVHYCVTNIPGAVARTATQALNHATLPHALALADRGLDALREDPLLREGLNVHRGSITHPRVAEALGLNVVEPLHALA